MKPLAEVLKVGIFCVVLSLTFAPGTAFSAIPEITWSPVEVVDSPVSEVSSGSGASVLFSDGVWHVVYTRDGDLYYRSRPASGWLPSVRLTNDPAPSRNPHLASIGGQIHVVWEDERTGHPEVWTRHRSGEIWSSEECLTADGNPSRAPAIAGTGPSGYLVWEEGPDALPRIQGKAYDGGSWGPTEIVSSGPGAAAEPTVSGPSDYIYFPYIVVAWSDSRHGLPEIYARTRSADGTWEAEQRLTDLPGSCRHPSVHTEICCYDFINTEYYVGFENDQTGTWEAYSACAVGGFPSAQVDQVSATDGWASRGMSASGFYFSYSSCGFWGGPGSRYLAAWTDELGGGIRQHNLLYQSGIYQTPETEVISTQGLSTCVIGAAPGNPEAGLMVLWVESIAGQPTLWSRRGSMLGCMDIEVAVPPSVILAPEGLPETVVFSHDVCTGTPHPGDEIQLRFDAALNGALTWDPQQQHPNTPFSTTDGQGHAVFAIRGGGCSEAGLVYVACEGIAFNSVPGAKSPDVDGDCVVRQNDLDYVRSKLGTSDFCADLDGSGTVTADDEAIVIATMADHCSHITAVEDGELPVAASLFVSPNPCTNTANLILNLPPETWGRLRVVDVGGRLIRELEIAGEHGGPLVLPWDGKNQNGQTVPAGLYFAQLRLPGRTEQRPLVLLR